MRGADAARAPLAAGLLLLTCVALAQETVDEDPPLDFSFTQTAPGQLIHLDGFRLHADCQGEGDVTILFEPGLGGSAFEWQPVQQVVSSRARACVYDRAGYAWSDPSPHPRDARRLAQEADELLKKLQVDGPADPGGAFVRWFCHAHAG